MRKSRRNDERPSAEHIPLTRTPVGQVSLPALVRMVQRQAKHIDAYERIAAQQGQVAARPHWDTNGRELRVDPLLDRVDYDAVRLPILVVTNSTIARVRLTEGKDRK